MMKKKYIYCICENYLLTKFHDDRANGTQFNAQHSLYTKILRTVA